MTLLCRNLSLAWDDGAAGSTPLLRRVNGRFDYGRVTLVTGPTGSGKSSLLHLLAGLIRPTSGEVADGDDPVSRWTTRHKDRWRRQVGICFQGLHLMPRLTLSDNVLQPLIPRPMAWSAMRRQAHEAITRLDLDHCTAIPVPYLSGGQQQRAAVARAIVHGPKILLLDEPTAFQDDAHARMLMDLMHDSARGGACVVVCSHDQRVRHQLQPALRYRIRAGTLEAAA